MPDVTMDEAWFESPEDRGDESTRQVIQARVTGKALRPGNVYYDQNSHHGHLSCRYCDVRVTHVNGTASIAGDNLGGASSHFRSLEGHKGSCQWEIRPQDRSNSKIDKTKGYKIHWNNSVRPDTRSIKAGRVYVRGEDHKIQTLIPDLEGRESKKFITIDDIVEIMEKADLARLNDSLVVRHNHVMPWDEFFIRAPRTNDLSNRFNALANSLSHMPARPVLLEVFNVKAVIPGQHRKKLFGVGSEVYLFDDPRGRGHFMRPQIWLDHPSVHESMANEGSYLVLGTARLSDHHERSAGRVGHFLNISVTSPDQIKQISLHEIVSNRSPS